MIVDFLQIELLRGHRPLVPTLFRFDVASDFQRLAISQKREFIGGMQSPMH